MRLMVFLNKVIIVVCIWLTPIVLVAQTTVLLQTTKDTRIQSNLPNTNLGQSQFFRGHSGTANFVPCIDRSFIEFDLNSIPPNSYILKATLSLFANTYYAGHSTLSGTNACWLERITTSWYEDSVTWNNQPLTEIQNRVAIPFSEFYNQNYENILVTEIIKDMLAYPGISYGFMIKLQEETDYREMQFASSDAGNVAIHPKLTILYCSDTIIENFITITPESDYGKDSRIQNIIPTTNIGDSQFFRAHSGTSGGALLVDRSLIEFDFSSIPSNSYILKATLSLMANTYYGGHSTLDGTNASWIEAVVEPWEEYSLTWNNQPATTTSNKVSIPMSDSCDQDYPDILVTEIVKDMYNDPSNRHGFMIKLQIESGYREMQFGSSDAINQSIYPSINIWYSNSFTTQQESVEITEISCNVFPNPAIDQLYITNNTNQKLRYKIFDSAGNMVLCDKIGESNNYVDISTLTYGCYLVYLTNGNLEFCKKILKL
ncbi:MAG: DNRLRE domain-containing protein [Bacteroidota bacterium]|nr:DNRLRE domain-containing protein [Bacteroidota bacterium]